jgi:hypothetical protein
VPLACLMSLELPAKPDTETAVAD